MNWNSTICNVKLYLRTTLHICYVISSYITAKCGEVSVGLVFSETEGIHKNDPLINSEFVDCVGSMNRTLLSIICTMLSRGILKCSHLTDTCFAYNVKLELWYCWVKKKKTTLKKKPSGKAKNLSRYFENLKRYACILAREELIISCQAYIRDCVQALHS